MTPLEYNAMAKRYHDLVRRLKEIGRADELTGEETVHELADLVEAAEQEMYDDAFGAYLS